MPNTACQTRRSRNGCNMPDAPSKFYVWSSLFELRGVCGSQDDYDAPEKYHSPALCEVQELLRAAHQPRPDLSKGAA